EVVDLTVAQVFAGEACALKPRGDKRLAAGVVRCHRRAGDEVVQQGQDVRHRTRFHWTSHCRSASYARSRVTPGVRRDFGNGVATEAPRATGIHAASRAWRAPTGKRKSVDAEPLLEGVVGEALADLAVLRHHHR